MFTTLRPIPAETEHERLPTWTRRGCASAAATAVAIVDQARDRTLGSICARPMSSVRKFLPGRRCSFDARQAEPLWASGETTIASDYYASSLREALSLCIDAASGGLPKLPATRNAGAETTAA